MNSAGYEIPAALSSLYRHWDEHTKPRSVTAGVQLNERLLAQIDAFIAERMRVWHKKQTGAGPPLTEDAILCDFRFCNIYRELDRQTIEIHRLLAPLRDADEFDLWLLNAAFCRFVCNPQTVRDVGLLSFDSANNRAVMQRLLAHPRPKYGVAYIFPISTIQRSRTPTRESFFCEHLPAVIPRIGAIIRQQTKVSVNDLLELILPTFGFNLAFHWTEILIDVAYQWPQFVDLYKSFPIGPGSLPTMKRLYLGEADAVSGCVVSGSAIAVALVSHRPAGFPYLLYKGKPVLLSAENWEGIGCEFRKYTNLSNGLGRRRKYS